MSFINFGTPEKRLQSARKFTEDYENITFTDEKGKTRKKAVYRGTWFVLRNEPAETVRLTALSAASSVLAFVFCLLTELVSYGPEGSLFVVLPQAAALFAGLYLLFGLAELPYKGKPMERNRYMHSIIRMCRAGTTGAILMAFSLLAGLAWRFVKKDWLFLTGDLCHLLFQVLSAVFFFFPVILLQKLEVSERPDEFYKSLKNKS